MTDIPPIETRTVRLDDQAVVQGQRLTLNDRAWIALGDAPAGVPVELMAEDGKPAPVTPSVYDTPKGLMWGFAFTVVLTAAVFYWAWTYAI